MKPGISPLAIGIVALALTATADTHYVNLNNPSPTPPYTNWLTAATNIQDAVDAAEAGDTVLVTNGVYATGGRLWAGSGTNRVQILSSLTLRSMNGPTATFIQGNHGSGTNATRCVFMGANTVLSGFTLTNGQSGVGNYPTGGGVYCASSSIVSNCLLVGNIANDAGGGAYRGTLVNCIITDNFAGGSIYLGSGGGAYGARLINCTLTGNSAASGGGLASGSATNCILYYNYNTSGGSGPNHVSANLSCCCATPLPGGAGNITNVPLFVNTNGWSDLRLQSNSPCINAGNTAYVTSSTDLDGNPRIAGGTVDMGAYEFQSPSSVLSYAWAQQYGLPTDGSADFVDTDNEGMNNWQEWRSDTVPTNAASALRMATVTNAPVGLAVSWDSVSSRSYWLERGGDLGAAPAFQTIATNIPGVPGVKIFNDLSATNGGPYFYRVGVQ